MKNKKKKFLLLGVILVTLVVFTPINDLFAEDEEVSDNKEIVVLLHGLGRNTTSMCLLASWPEDAGYDVDKGEINVLDLLDTCRIV